MTWAIVLIGAAGFAAGCWIGRRVWKAWGRRGWIVYVDFSGKVGGEPEVEHRFTLADEKGSLRGGHRYALRFRTEREAKVAAAGLKFMGVEVEDTKAFRLKRIGVMRYRDLLREGE